MKKIFLCLLLSITFVVPCLCLVACDEKSSNANTNESYEIMIEVEDKRGFDLSVEKVSENSDLWIITDGLDNYAYVKIDQGKLTDTKVSENFVSFKLYASIFSDQIEIFVNNVKVEKYNMITSEDGFYNCYDLNYHFNDNLVIKFTGNFEIL